MHAHPNFCKEITYRLAEQEALGGVYVDKLPKGTRLEVQTRNTLYEMEIIKQREIWVRGGKYFPTRTQITFQGSTWGGSMLKVAWIGFDMKMEFLRLGQSILSTSIVKKAKIIAHDDSWEYQMEWDMSKSCNACATT